MTSVNSATEALPSAAVEARTIGELVDNAASKWGTAKAWTFDEFETSYTFADVAGLVAEAGAWLSAQGVRSGDVVVVLARNTIEFPISWLGLCHIGATMVPLNINYRRADARHVLSSSRPDFLLVAEEFMDFADAISDDRPILSATEMVQLGLTRRPVHEMPQALRKWGGSDGSNRPKIEVRTGTSTPVANIQFTSGTTGAPKGCVLDHQYWLTLGASLCSEFPFLRSDDVMLTAQPFHYIDPQWHVVAGLFSGAELVILDRFHPSTLWSDIRRNGVTYFYCLGMMPKLLLSMPPTPDDRRHNVRRIQCSAIPKSIHVALEERWGVRWYEAFGMTETGADLYVSEAEHDELVGTGCLGRPRRHRTARVVDGSGAECEPGIEGELILSGSGLAQGYFGDEEASSRSFQVDGFHTGDIVVRDEAGRLYYRGRLKDMIRRSGENIAAGEVEATVLRHPSVHGAAVVGVPDDLRGEEVLACIIADSADEYGVDALLKEIRSFCQDELAYFKVPRFWALVHEFPMTDSERVNKKRLVDAICIDDCWDSSTDRDQ